MGTLAPTSAWSQGKQGERGEPGGFHSSFFTLDMIHEIGMEGIGGGHERRIVRQPLLGKSRGDA